MLSYLFPAAGALFLLSGTVALVLMALAMRTAVRAKPKQLKEVRVEFSSKRRIVMQWHDPAPPNSASHPRPQLVRDSEDGAA